MGRTRLAAVALPLILVLAACSSGGGATAAPSTAANPTAAPSTAGGGASPSATAGEAEYELKVSPGAGSVTNFLTDGDGKTLYLFTADTKDSGKSVCNGDCAANWPPLTVGTKQLSYNGMPLYYFAADKAAGDTNGQGVGGKWFIVNP